MKNILVGTMIVILLIVLTGCGDENAPEPCELGDEGLVEEILTEEIQVEEILTDTIEIETITIEDSFKPTETRTI
jgi:hypothetical protein